MSVSDYAARRVLVTGGCGFIGSNFVRHVLDHDPHVSVVNLDALTYAGNLENLRDVEEQFGERYVFHHGDIRDPAAVQEAIAGCDTVVHFAAESHVDRSIAAAHDFITTNVEGTYIVLEGARRAGVGRFLHVSTDEVYGSTEEGSFAESDPLRPSSPYSASKAAADLVALAHYATYGLPVVVTRSTNNFGPYQFPEKLIPLFVTNLMDNQPVPLYGDGLNIRDWIHVLDNCEGLGTVLRRGKPGGIYNVGAGNEVSNRYMTDCILKLLGAGQDMVQYVPDRLGHDRRYSVITDRARALGWAPTRGLEQGLAETIAWYKSNRDWWEPLKQSGR